MSIEYDEMIIMRKDFEKMIAVLGLEISEPGLGGPMTIKRPPMCETNSSKVVRLPYVAARKGWSEKKKTTPKA